MKVLFAIISCVILGLPSLAYPSRIISTTPAITEILYAISADDQVVGVTTNCNYPFKVRFKEKVGGFFINLEKVVSLKPDLVIMQKDAQPKEIERIRKQKLNVLEVRLQSIPDVYDAILLIGKTIGKMRKAEHLVEDMRYRIQKTKEKVNRHQPVLSEVLSVWGKGIEKRQVLVMVGYNPMVVAGGGTFIDDILSAAGVKNVAGSTRTAYPQYSFEKLVSENPQYIIVPKGLLNRDQVQDNRYWQSLDAVRNKRILMVDADILSRPGPRLVDAIEQIADFVYNHN